MLRQNYRKLIVAIFVILSVLLSLPHYFKAVEDSRPRHGGDGWKVSLPREQGINPELLQKASSYLKKTSATNFIVIRHGSIVYEKFFRGQRPGDFSYCGGAANLLLSTLLGVAIDNGVITNIDEKVISFYKENTSKIIDNRVYDISIKQLLTMTSGFGIFPESIFHTRDWIGRQLGSRLEKKPGREFINSPKSTYLLSGILNKRSGKSALDYAKESIFKPMSFGKVIWQQGPENYNIGGDFLFMKALDLAKLGCLYLNNGIWQEHRILKEAWIKDALKIQVNLKNRKNNEFSSDCIGFGYNLAIRSIGGHICYTAEGNDTPPNLCFIPDLDMVVVITSYPGIFKSAYRYENLKRVLDSYIIPAVEN